MQVVGVLTGSVAVFLSSPLWVANTRLKLQGVTVGAQCSSGRQPVYSGIVGM